MIISQRTRKTPRWLTAGVIALSMGLLPLGVAYAQNFNAVGNRLRQAVIEGELTEEQARAMMETLHCSAANEVAGEHGKDHDLEELKARIEERLSNLEFNLHERVLAGEITKEEMEAEYRAAERDIWDRYRQTEMQTHLDERAHRQDHDLEELKARIEEQLMDLEFDLHERVLAGEITEAEMEAEYRAAERDMLEHYQHAEMQAHLDEFQSDGSQRDENANRVQPRFIPEEEYNRVVAELERQVAAGKISQEEVTRKTVEMQMANTMAHIEQSVKEGEMSRAEADALYKRMGIR